MRSSVCAAIACILSCSLVSAQGSITEAEVTQSKANYVQARQEIENMLSGKIPASYERAIYLTENAWWDNSIPYDDFRKLISYGVGNIQAIQAQSSYKGNRKESQDFFEALRQKNHQDQGYADGAKTNYAIYTYMTDTTFFLDSASRLARYHLPYRYATSDPLGTADFTNTQVGNLLFNGKGNCFAFVSLFKIYAERLKADASICTAPGHVYIRHRDDNGILFNVELSSRTFPGTGALSTLTYTTKEAIENGIALRELDLQQSIALNLIYLAKGYEYKFLDNDIFVLSCADLALKYDSQNLNAMLLKTEVLERQILASGKTIAQLQRDKTFQAYETLIGKLYGLGYREMPLAMKNMLIKGWSRDTVSTLAYRSYEPKSNNPAGTAPTRYASLSWGLFDEQITNKPIERYGRVLFDTKKRTVTSFAREEKLYNNYNFDPVVFALSVDPLAEKFYSMSPYVAMGNNPVLNIDPDGRAFFISVGDNGVDKNGQAFFSMLNARSGNVFALNQSTGEVTFAEGKTLGDVGEGGSLALATAVAAGIGPNSQGVYFNAVGKDASVDFDDYGSGKVDVSDLSKADNASQAALMGHFITERFATEEYEKNKGSNMKDYVKKSELYETTGNRSIFSSNFWKAHLAGIETDKTILTEMTGIDIMPLKRDESVSRDGRTTFFEYGTSIQLYFTRSAAGHVIDAQVRTR